MGRFYVEVARQGAPLKYLDVGGGLGVDYDGSQTNFASSMNYTTEEYANDVVFRCMEACDGREVPHPHLVSESGRAMVAHHAVLVTEVLGVERVRRARRCPSSSPRTRPQVVQNLCATCRDVTRKNLLEAYHDATEYKEECLTLFSLGHLIARRSAWRPRTCSGRSATRSCGSRASSDDVPEELEALEHQLSDTYFCNFSVFQSLPDSLGDRSALPDHADPPPQREARRAGRCWPTSPATATARSSTSSTSAT